MKKYKARVSPRWGCEARITEVEAERETKQSIWINGRRNAKVSSWETYFDSWDEAKAALIESQSLKIENLRIQVQRGNSLLNELRGMKQ